MFTHDTVVVLLISINLKVQPVFGVIDLFNGSGFVFVPEVFDEKVLFRLFIAFFMLS